MGLVAACRYSATCWGLVGSCAGSRRFVENLWRLVVSRGDSRRLAATRGVSWRLVENLWCLVETRGDSRRLAAIRGDSWRLVGGSRGLVLVLFPYWVSPPWPCLGFGPRPGVRGVSRRCLASCLFLVVLLGVVSRLDYGVPAASGLGRGLLPFVLGLGLSGSSCVVVLLLSGIVSPLRPLLGCLGSGRVLSSPPPPSSWSLSPLFAVTLETRVALLARCWLAAGSLLARMWSCTTLYRGTVSGGAGPSWASRLLRGYSSLGLSGLTSGSARRVWITLAACLRLAPSLAPPGLSCQVTSRSPRRSRPSFGFRPGWFSRFTLCPTRVVSICLRPARWKAR